MRETRLMESPRAFEVPQSDAHHAGRCERPHAGCDSEMFGKREERLQELPAFAKVAAISPIPPEGAGQSQGVLLFHMLRDRP
jgi:hypothetical protein